MTAYRRESHERLQSEKTQSESSLSQLLLSDGHVHSLLSLSPCLFLSRLAIVLTRMRAYTLSSLLSHTLSLSRILILILSLSLSVLLPL